MLSLKNKLFVDLVYIEMYIEINTGLEYLRHSLFMVPLVIYKKYVQFRHFNVL